MEGYTADEAIKRIRGGRGSRCTLQSRLCRVVAKGGTSTLMSGIGFLAPVGVPTYCWDSVRFWHSLTFPLENGLKKWFTLRMSRSNENLLSEVCDDL